MAKINEFFMDDFSRGNCLSSSTGVPIQNKVSQAFDSTSKKVIWIATRIIVTLVAQYHSERFTY